MAKVQGKKAAAAGKKTAKKVVARVKKAAVATKKKVAAKKPPAPTKRSTTKAIPKKAAVKKPAPKPVSKGSKASPKAAKPVAKPVRKAAEKVKKAAKAVKAVTKKVIAKATPKPSPKSLPKKAAKAAPPKPAAKPAKSAAAPKAAPKPAPKAAAKAPETKPAAPAAASAPAVPPRAPEPEKKRGRRPRPRIQSNGVPTAAWLTSEKPRPASFIPAPARAEAPSAIAAPPASSDRLLRPDDVEHPAVRTVPVRIDIEQGAGRFYVIANPIEVTVRAGEGIEWDFRYLGGADVSVEEVVIEFSKPAPFPHAVFRTRKPGGARPHRQMSEGALPAATGKRIEYTVRAFNPFKTELASAKVWVNVGP